MRADHDTVARYHDNIVIVLYGCDHGNLAELIRAVIDKPLAAAVLHAVIFKITSSAEARFRNGQQRIAVKRRGKANHIIILVKAYGAHAPCRSADQAGVVFIKADAHAAVRCNNKLSCAVRYLNIGKLVALVKINRNDAALADMFIFVNIRSFDDSLLRDHAKVTAALLLRYLDHGGDGLSLFKRQKVHNIHALARP